MSYNLYGTFTTEDAANIGNKVKARCKANYGYEGRLTVDRIYEVEITPRILPMSPLCKLIGDKGKGVECHLERFEKEGEAK